MILLDSTVVIDYTRGKDPKLHLLFSSLKLGVCGIVRSEVLTGWRTAADRAKLIAILNGLTQVSTPDSVWDTVGDNLAELRRHGLTVPVPDAVIATLGMNLNIEVWSRDPHFAAMQRILPTLKLFQEPP
ncbi:MAG TPA: PIN domain-containing protein [Gemmataceae bacterium]|nr:PIN domain-containing protein [Gemmataceae bacterium]